MQGTITIPYIDGDTCVLLRGRKLNPRPGEKYLSPKGPLYAGGVPRFYLGGTLGEHAQVILTEGEIKALAAWQAWQSGAAPMPCVATCGVMYLPQALADRMAGRVVYLAYDSEAPKHGQRPASELAIARNGAKLQRAGATVKVIELPRPAGVQKVDLDSYLLAA